MQAPVHSYHPITYYQSFGPSGHMLPSEGVEAAEEILRTQQTQKCEQKSLSNRIIQICSLPQTHYNYKLPLIVHRDEKASKGDLITYYKFSICFATCILFVVAAIYTLRYLSSPQE